MSKFIEKLKIIYDGIKPFIPFIIDRVKTIIIPLFKKPKKN
jgi:hypothetical protein